jgi:hypothetical protein
VGEASLPAKRSHFLGKSVLLRARGNMNANQQEQDQQEQDVVVPCQADNKGRQRGGPRGPPKERRATGARPPPQWKTSAAKALLVRLLSDELSWIHQATVNEVYEADPLFKRFPFKNFKTNFANLKASIKEEKDAINFDQEAFKKETELFPRNPTTKAGNPFWDKHDAQRLMAEDVKAGKTLQMKPSKLQETRIEYQAFPLSILRGHKYQEERKEREAVYWLKKRNDKARKKHEKEVIRMQEEGTRTAQAEDAA